MTIELTDDELQEIVKALEMVRRLHEECELPAYHLSQLVDQLRVHLPGSRVMPRPKLKTLGNQVA